MDDCSTLSDAELVAVLRQYNIPHGPVVGSTRKLYEKMILEYETQRWRLSPQTASASSVSSCCADSDSSSGDSCKYDLPKKEDALLYQSKGYNGNCYEEHYLNTSTHGEPEAVRTAKNSREPVDSLSDPDTLYHQVRADSLYMSSEEECKDGDFHSYARDSAYQSVAHYRPGPSVSRATLGCLPNYPTTSSTSSTSSSSYSPPSLLDHSRHAVQPKKQDQGACLDQDCHLPLWGQLLLFLGFTAFLFFVYYFMQIEDENHFMMYP